MNKKKIKFSEAFHIKDGRGWCNPANPSAGPDDDDMLEIFKTNLLKTLDEFLPEKEVEAKEDSL